MSLVCCCSQAFESELRCRSGAGVRPCSQSRYLSGASVDADASLDNLSLSTLSVEFSRMRTDLHCFSQRRNSVYGLDQ